MIIWIFGGAETARTDLLWHMVYFRKKVRDFMESLDRNERESNAYIKIFKAQALDPSWRPCRIYG